MARKPVGAAMAHASAALRASARAIVFRRVAANDSIAEQPSDRGAEHAASERDGAEADVRPREARRVPSRHELGRPVAEASEGEGVRAGTGDDAQVAPVTEKRREIADEIGSLGAPRDDARVDRGARGDEHEARGAGDEERAPPSERSFDEAAEHEARGRSEVRRDVEPSEPRRASVRRRDAVEHAGRQRRETDLARADDGAPDDERREPARETTRDRPRAPHERARREDRAAATAIGDDADDRARDQIAGEERSAEEPAVRVPEVELGLDPRKHRGEHQPIRVREHVHEREQDEDGQAATHAALSPSEDPSRQSGDRRRHPRVVAESLLEGSDRAP
jgi:hypothetical protein